MNPPNFSPEIVSKAANIRNIGEYKSIILEALKANSEVVLDIPEDTDVDLSFVQVIESARLYATSNNRVLKLARPADGLVLKILQRSGVLESFKAQDASFWLHKEDLQ